MTIASLVKCPSYDQTEVSSAIERSVDLIGGAESFFKPGERILLKINLLGAYPPEKRITTHPSVVGGLIELIRKAGAEPIVGDSPGGINTHSSFKRLSKITGIGPLCAEMGVELVLFDADLRRLDSPSGKLYKFFDAAGVLREVDGVVAAPVLKTHGLMRITCAVKVLFGLLSGVHKLQYHVKVPSRRDFADMLVDLYLAVKPRLAVVDAVVAMEGEGPAHGDPISLGAIIAAPDCLVADVAACRLIGIDPLSVYTTAAAAARGLVDVEDVVLLGDPPELFSANEFRLPKSDLEIGSPSGAPLPFARRWFRNVSTAKPALKSADTCTSCATCQRICPVQAIEMRNKKPTFDYENCIRCYCCEELCPEGAIERRNHWLIGPLARLYGLKL